MKLRSVFAAAIVALAGLAGGADAAILRYATDMSGAAESPPVGSPASGRARLLVDTLARTFAVDAEFSDLVGTTTAAHIHGPTPTPGEDTAGVMTEMPSFALFPLGVTAGSFADTYDMTDISTWNPGFVTTQGSLAAAEAAFLAALAEGRAYFNIHTTFAPGGEIRGFFAPAPIPLPAGSLLILTALGALGVAGARRRA